MRLCNLWILITYYQRLIRKVQNSTCTPDSPSRTTLALPIKLAPFRCNKESWLIYRLWGTPQLLAAPRHRAFTTTLFWSHFDNTTWPLACYLLLFGWRNRTRFTLFSYRWLKLHLQPHHIDCCTSCIDTNIDTNAPKRVAILKYALLANIDNR
jgi:hypothetical protein